MVLLDDMRSLATVLELDAIYECTQQAMKDFQLCIDALELFVGDEISAQTLIDAGFGKLIPWLPK